MKFDVNKIFAATAYAALGLIVINDNKLSKHLTIYVVCFFIILFFFNYYIPLIREKLCLKKVQEIIREHEIALSIQQNRLITKDIYGNVREVDWDKEVKYFIENTIINKRLTDREKDILNYEKPYKKTVDFVKKVASERSQFFLENIQYSENLSGKEYELLCKDILVKNGWSVETTKIIGDQGVDLIATKNNNIVAIQCKKYSSNIGNWAVQEIIAGKVYYRATYGAVVSNAPYTKAAKELAKVNKVSLLHHYDLLKEDFFLMEA